MKPADIPRCEKCQVAKPFLAHWCPIRECPCTDQRQPTQEARNIIEGKAYNE